MASRYISRRYGSSSATTQSQIRSTSQVRETNSNYYSQSRSRSVAPTSLEENNLVNYYAEYVGRSKYSQQRELSSTPEFDTSNNKQSLALKTLHLPIWTSSWRNYSGRGIQSTSQFLGSQQLRSARMTTPTFEPPRVFIYHKSTVN